MDRAAYETRYRRWLGIALGVSLGVHAAALAWVELAVPTFESPERARALQVVDLPDDWRDRAIQTVDVVALESAEASAAEGVASEAAATSAPVDATQSGAAGAETRVAAIVPLSSPPGAAPREASPHLELAAAPALATPVVETRRANRGIVQREGGGGASAASGYDFVAANDAARDAERERGGAGWGGTGGIGVTILGGGGDCAPGATGAGGIPVTRGLGGLASGSPARGILGRRAPGGGAINRVLPGR